ncbi:Cytosolic copper metallochaperone [Elasticomyces elasticus]|nr:hypothetical protein LTR28_005727 [Elasticomyces elasticus]KAK4998469.1 Cytosolic copper metallochaperone [Elasticomyces elasticus]
MADHIYKIDITMTCGGCSGTVERVLKKLDGIKSYDVSLDTQSANLVAADSLDYQTILEKIKKTGKKVNKGEADGELWTFKTMIGWRSRRRGTTVCVESESGGWRGIEEEVSE